VRELPEQLEIELARRVGLLAASFPSAVVPAATLKVYARMLADIPLAVLDVVIEQCLAECKFFPTIAELRERVLAHATPAGAHPDAAEAWGLVLAEIKREGHMGTPRFADEVVARAVRIMDWWQLCVSENPVADRAHFMRIYEQLRERELADARLLPRTREMRAFASASVGERVRLEWWN